jgi:hypothetical protein
MAASLGRARDELAADRELLADRRAQLDAAERRLDREVSRRV